MSAATLSHLSILLLLSSALALPPNFEDIHNAVDQAVDEKVDISQDNPQSNAIHIAHNNPKGSDIKVVQTNPFNTTVHISLNVGKDSKVVVMMSNARNLQLHVSFNGMANSECEVDIAKAFNSTVHLSFQNPRNTPVVAKMTEAVLCHLHVSQNIPNNSPMEVSMSDAEDCQIHLSQAVPMYSPLTWDLQGDPDLNQIEVSQNAADANSPLTCNPECPQEEYVYDYAYADGGNSNDAKNGHQKEETKQRQFGNDDIEDYPKSYDDNLIEEVEYPENVADNSDLHNGDDYAETQFTATFNEDELVDDEAAIAEEDVSCPGDDLQTCVDVCPGQYGAAVYGACVVTCGKRCP